MYVYVYVYVCVCVYVCKKYTWKEKCDYLFLTCLHLYTFDVYILIYAKTLTLMCSQAQTELLMHQYLPLRIQGAPS